MTKHGRHDILHEGTAATVLAITLHNGSCPVTAWLATLDDRGYAGILARVEMLAERGWLRNPDSMNGLADRDAAKDLPRVDEIKHVGANLRLYVVDYNPGHGVIYTTHGGTKPNKKGVAREVLRARKIYEEK